MNNYETFLLIVSILTFLLLIITIFGIKTNNKLKNILRENIEIIENYKKKTIQYFDAKDLKIKEVNDK